MLRLEVHKAKKTRTGDEDLMKIEKQASKEKQKQTRTKMKTRSARKSGTCMSTMSSCDMMMDREWRQKFGAGQLLRAGGRLSIVI